MLSIRCLSVLSVCDVGVLWPNGWMDQDETWHGGRPRPRPHCVRWGPSYPLPKRHSPQFSAHVCCGQMAGLTEMPLVTEVGLSPGDIVLYWDPALPKRGHTPTFRPMSIVAKWLDGLSLGTEVGLGLGNIVLDGDPAAPKRDTAPIFGLRLLWPNGRPSQLLLSTCDRF